MLADRPALGSPAQVRAAALEVTPNDWAAVMLRDVFHAGRLSGFGTVACAGAMLVGRLSRMAQRSNAKNVLSPVGPVRWISSEA